MGGGAWWKVWLGRMKINGRVYLAFIAVNIHAVMRSDRCYGGFGDLSSQSPRAYGPWPSMKVEADSSIPASLAERCLGGCNCMKVPLTSLPSKQPYHPSIYHPNVNLLAPARVCILSMSAAVVRLRSKSPAELLVGKIV